MCIVKAALHATVNCERERERETEALATASAPTHAPLLRFGSAVARWQVEYRYGELKGEGGQEGSTGSNLIRFGSHLWRKCAHN